MSDPVVVRCPSCSQKYRVPPASVGHQARCRKCSAEFVIAADAPVDEDAIVAWITEGDPMSKSVMGSTGIFENAPNPLQAPVAPVYLRSIDAKGALFEFSVAALQLDEVRNAFPRKCIGCAARGGLRVHLIHWPEKMTSRDASHGREQLDTSVGRLETFSLVNEKGLLRQLPRSRHSDAKFTLPFPVFACEHCHVSREIEAHVEMGARGDMCRLLIKSLSVAVEFFRNAGGRDTPEYRKLVEQRDLRRDPWHELNPKARQGISSWLELANGEQFVAYYPEPGAPGDPGTAGAVLTNRRLALRHHGASHAYPLDQPGRVEIMSTGDDALVHIYEAGHPPATLRLDRGTADDLARTLRKAQSRWAVLT